MVKKIVIEGNEIAYNLDNPVIKRGSTYGILENKQNICKINNKIYEQVICGYIII
ncbi:hypothetical protein SH2C18_44870 [Clostridium sediminicola]